MKFGDRLKKTRTDLNLTQEQVADDFFITRQTISSWENEKTYPDISSLIKLSDYYHISLDTLLKEDSGMKEYLEKKEIARSIKPIYMILVFVDFIFLSLMVLRWLNFLPINHLAFFLIFVFGISNAIALINIGLFREKIGIKKSNVLFTTKCFAISIAILISCLLFSLFTQQNYIINGILSSILFTIICLYSFQKTISKRRNK